MLRGHSVRSDQQIQKSVGRSGGYKSNQQVMFIGGAHRLRCDRKIKENGG